MRFTITEKLNMEEVLKKDMIMPKIQKNFLKRKPQNQVKARAGKLVLKRQDNSFIPKLRKKRKEISR